MTNRKKAIELIINFFESEGISCGTPEIAEKVDKWENRLDPIDYTSLAAVAICDPQENVLSEAEIRTMREFYFPSENFLEGGFI